MSLVALLGGARPAKGLGGGVRALWVGLVVGASCFVEVRAWVEGAAGQAAVVRNERASQAGMGLTTWQ